MAIRKSSLRDLAARAKEPTELAAANSPSGTNRIVELDPSRVHAGGLEDRYSTDDKEIAVLAQSLTTVGQRVPIIVRPHPDRPGEYQIVAGRRRLAACRFAGLPVRAEIQDLDERNLVLGQAVENVAREDLSYIERARLAVRMIDQAGLAPQEIDAAFSCGKTDRSRYIKIGRGVPDDILVWIGKAEEIGRPRWELFVAAIAESKEALARVKAALAAANEFPGSLTSEQRFTHLYDAARGQDASKPALSAPSRTQASPHDIYVGGIDSPVARIKASRSGVQLTLLAGHQTGFLEWVEAHREDIVRRLLEEHAAGMDAAGSDT